MSDCQACNVADLEAGSQFCGGTITPTLLNSISDVVVGDIVKDAANDALTEAIDMQSCLSP